MLPTIAKTQQQEHDIAGFRCNHISLKDLSFLMKIDQDCRAEEMTGMQGEPFRMPSIGRTCTCILYSLADRTCMTNNPLYR